MADPAPGDKIRFAKYDGGRIVEAEGELVELVQDFVRVSHGGVTVSFRRAPGPKAGWGTGVAKSWRIGMDERKRLCHPDVPHRRG